MIDLDAIERRALAAQAEMDEHPMWPTPTMCSPLDLLKLIKLIREYEREHRHDCIREIGKRAGYWDCDCEP